MTEPIHIPETSLLRYFRDTVAAKGVGTADRLAQAKQLLAAPETLTVMFADSLEQFSAYRNDQPFRPAGATFGAKPSGVLHGAELRSTVDVAQRLSRRGVWTVAEDSRLNFAYLDRELELARCRPAPTYPRCGKLILDLLLVNVRDRIPILCELKIRSDKDAFYALIQLLAQAVYALTPHQRARLCLYGSRADRVIAEAVPGKPALADLYILLHEPPQTGHHPETRKTAIALSHAIAKEPAIRSVIRRVSWLEVKEIDPPSPDIAVSVMSTT